MHQYLLSILYVKNQELSRNFYTNVLEMQPCLDVPGMTEFELSPFSKLGLMPESSIAKLICPPCKNPALGRGIPRAELYFMVENPPEKLNLVLRNGGNLIRECEKMDWGHWVAYAEDLDGHILAFACL